MNITDIFSLAYRTVRSNKLRTGLTVAIIAFGIMALVGIITAIKAMNQKFTESFSTMGANGFTIRFKERQIHFGGGDQISNLRKKARGRKRPRVLENQSTLSRQMRSEQIIRFRLQREYRFLSTGIRFFLTTQKKPRPMFYSSVPMKTIFC